MSRVLFLFCIFLLSARFSQAQVLSCREVFKKPSAVRFSAVDLVNGARALEDQVFLQTAIQDALEGAKKYAEQANRFKSDRYLNALELLFVKGWSAAEVVAETGLGLKTVTSLLDWQKFKTSYIPQGNAKVLVTIFFNRLEREITQNSIPANHRPAGTVSWSNFLAAESANRKADGNSLVPGTVYSSERLRDVSYLQNLMVLDTSSEALKNQMLVELESFTLDLNSFSRNRVMKPFLKRIYPFIRKDGVTLEKFYSVPGNVDLVDIIFEKFWSRKFNDLFQDSVRLGPLSQVIINSLEHSKSTDPVLEHIQVLPALKWSILADYFLLERPLSAKQIAEKYQLTEQGVENFVNSFFKSNDRVLVSTFWAAERVQRGSN